MTAADGFCVAKTSIRRVINICIVQYSIHQAQLTKVHGPYACSRADVKYVVRVLNRCKIELAIESFYEEAVLKI
jgi:hypothetical protein